MNKGCFIAGDWGTSHLRLFLCDAEGGPIERVQGPGAAAVAGDFCGTFDTLTRAWKDREGPLPAILCGMVGSNLGWSHAPYLPCPAHPEQVARACVELRDHQVRIVPGLSCRNRFGAPDVLRGEETQVLGALRIEPRLGIGRHLLCLPGTHTKWARLQEGSIDEFLTAPTGELYALIREHSVLLAGTQTHPGLCGPQFQRALEEWQREPRAHLLHRIFECRSRRVTGEISDGDAADYLSGLLIGSDVKGALDLFGGGADDVVCVIGSPQLTQLYVAALRATRRNVLCIDGDNASIAGLAQIQSFLSLKGTRHAI